MHEKDSDHQTKTLAAAPVRYMKAGCLSLICEYESNSYLAWVSRHDLKGVQVMVRASVVAAMTLMQGQSCRLTDQG